jgi:D-alanyl-lipoteichoic acid acyltransferase DltB (MBOAT superfamily)
MPIQSKICKGNRIRSLDFFANFLDQAKKWKNKKEKKNILFVLVLLLFGIAKKATNSDVSGRNLENEKCKQKKIGFQLEAYLVK